MSYFNVDTNAASGSSINTLSAEGGAPTPPLGTNFDFSSTATGALTFATPGTGLMTAEVNVDGTTITVNGSNQLQAVNSFTGTGTTVGATTADLITVTPTDLKAFSVQALVAGYDAANDAMNGGEVLRNGRRNGNVTIVGTPDTTENEDAGLGTTVIDLVASGTNFIIRVTGVAGRTIVWGARLMYVSSP